MHRAFLVATITLLFAENTYATLILFPGTEAQIVDTANTGLISVPNPLTIPGTDLTFKGDVRVTKGPADLVITITNAIVENPTMARVQYLAILLALDTYNFGGSSTDTVDGALVIGVQGFGINNTNEFGDVFGFEAAAAGNSVDGHAVVPFDPGLHQEISINRMNRARFSPPSGVLFAGLKDVDFGASDSITLPTSADFEATTSVPEPRTLFLFLSGLAGIILAVRSNRRRADHCSQ